MKSFSKKRTPPKILIVDDEKDILEILSSILTEEGCQVVCAEDGEEGLVQYYRVRPHLVILDMNMPRMGGVAFYHRIYDKRKEKSEVPVLVLTARTGLEELFLELNVDGFMTKPFQLETLLREVRVILKKTYNFEFGSLTKEAEVSKWKPLPLRVLVVEKKGPRREAIARLLSEKGYNTTLTDSALKAFEHTMEEGFDMIAIAGELEDLRGDLLAYRLKHLAHTAHIPLLLYDIRPDQNELMLEKRILQNSLIGGISAEEIVEQIRKKLKR